MGEYFSNQLESSIADCKNLGDEEWGENGAAAEFLKRFVYTPHWAHIDIAGVSWTQGTKPLVTAFGVKLLVDYLQR